MPRSFIKFSNSFLKKIYRDQFGEFVHGYWDSLRVKNFKTITLAFVHLSWFCTYC